VSKAKTRPPTPEPDLEPSAGAAAAAAATTTEPKQAEKHAGAAASPKRQPEVEGEEEKKGEQPKRAKKARTYVPLAPAPVAAPDVPDDATLLEAGEEMIEGATRIRWQWPNQNERAELAQLVPIENGGEGDCMYYSLAPMIRALKPALFEGIENNDIANMLRLRQLLAAHLPNDKRGLTAYIRLYADQYQRKQELQYLAKYEIDAVNNNVDIDESRVEQVRAQLADELMQKNHWFHFADFDLLGKLLGDTVAVVVFDSRHDGKAVDPLQGQLIPKFYHGLVNARKLNDESVRYVFVEFNAGIHFLRLQREFDAKFAFLPSEFNALFPFLWRAYNDTITPVQQLDIAVQINRLKDDIIDRFPRLGPFTKKEGRDASFDLIVHRLLGVPSTRDVDVGKVLCERDRRLQNYQSLTPAEKKEVQNRLISASAPGSVSPDERVDRFIKGGTRMPLREAVEIPTTAQPAASTTLPTTSATASTSAPSKFVVCEKLTQAEEAQVEAIFKEAKSVDFDKRPPQWEGEIITAKDFLRLRPDNWLNDVIINAYAIKLRQVDEVKRPAEFSKTFIHNTHFYKLLISNDGVTRVETHGGKEFNPFALEKLLVPIHIGGNHWVLAVINMAEKHIALYDSLNASTKKIAQHLKAYLEHMHKKVFGTPLDNDWKDTTPPAPKQENSDDCGVFTVAFIREAMRKNFNGTFKVTQKDIACLRKRIALELAQGERKAAEKKREESDQGDSDEEESDSSVEILPPKPAQQTTSTTAASTPTTLKQPIKIKPTGTAANASAVVSKQQRQREEFERQLEARAKEAKAKAKAEALKAKEENAKKAATNAAREASRLKREEEERKQSLFAEDRMKEAQLPE
jgi:hypothetical protein